MQIHRSHALQIFLLLFLIPAGTHFAFCQNTPKTLQERLGYPSNARLLVIHADDIGMSHSVNRASFEALEKGWITSASILVPCPWFPEVARFAKTHPNADLGIHLALNSEWNDFRWGPVSSVDKVPSLLDEHGYLPLVETTVAKQAITAEAETELRSQIEKAQAAGIHFSHFDSHMRALFLRPDLFHVYQHFGREYGVPVMDQKQDRPDNAEFNPIPGAVLLDAILGIDPGVARKDWLEAYKKILRPLPPGVYQLIVHLAYDDEEMRGATWDHPDYGSTWRQSDLDTVSNPEFQKFLHDQGFILVSWKDLARGLQPEYRQLPENATKK